jgi:hypothetical protein
MSEGATEAARHVGSSDDPKISTTIIVGVVGLVLVFVLILLLEVLYYRTVEAENYRKVISQQPEELRLARSEQLEQLNTSRWVDRENGVVAIPIDRAMRLVVEESRSAGGGPASP